MASDSLVDEEIDTNEFINTKKIKRKGEKGERMKSGWKRGKERRKNLISVFVPVPGIFVAIKSTGR